MSTGDRDVVAEKVIEAYLRETFAHLDAETNFPAEARHLAHLLGGSS